jgi:LPXTG-site transpeptidase (sortase) family protein
MIDSKPQPASGRSACRIEKSFLLLGVVALGIWTSWRIRYAVYQNLENQAFDRQIHSEGDRGVYGKSRQRLATRPDGLIGRLAIPRLHVQAVVREGDDENTLDLAIGHIPGTALPGQDGNVAVAGHRDTIFRNLGAVAKNDLIVFDTLAGSYAYEVESTQIVHPQDVGVLDPGAHPQLTLVTCYPFHYVGSAPDRFIVKARLVPQRLPEQAIAGISQQLSDSADRAAATRSQPSNGGVRKPAIRRVFFQVNVQHSRELVPGVLLRISRTDVSHRRVSGWMWVNSARRTIWLRDQKTLEPLVFYSHQEGKRREMMITRVTRSSVTGYLVLFGETRGARQI